MRVFKLFVFTLLATVLINGYSETIDPGEPQIQQQTQNSDTLGKLIKNHLIGYWVKIKDVSATPIWFADISATRHPNHWAYICGAGIDYVALCAPNGAFYSAIPTSNIRLGGLYTYPGYSVDLCKLGYKCSPPK